MDLKCSYWCDEKDSRACHSLDGCTRHANNGMITEQLASSFIPFLKAMRKRGMQSGEEGCCALFETWRCSSREIHWRREKIYGWCMYCVHCVYTVWPCQWLRSKANAFGTWVRRVESITEACTRSACCESGWSHQVCPHVTWHLRRAQKSPAGTTVWNGRWSEGVRTQLVQTAPKSFYVNGIVWLVS